MPIGKPSNKPVQKAVLEHGMPFNDFKLGIGVEVKFIAGREIIEREVAEVMPVRRVGVRIGAREVRRGYLYQAIRFQQSIHLFHKVRNVFEMLDHVAGKYPAEMRLGKRIRKPVQIPNQIRVDPRRPVHVEASFASLSPAAEIEFAR